MEIAVLIAVAEQSQVAQARRCISAFAGDSGAPAARIGAIAIVVTELATNLLKHAGGGEMLAGPFDDADGSGIEVLALDRGPGMESVERCLRDGYSSAGSLGQGLGAASRQSDRLRIWSRPNAGTVIAARFVLRPPAPGAAVQCGAAVAPYPGETACGDGWAWVDAPSGPTLLLADGSGHGPEAQRAAQTAVGTFRQHAGEDCETLLARLHRALMPTRGAALAVARIDRGASSVHYAGLGNISGRMFAPGRSTHMVSQNGTAGYVASRIRQFSYPFAAAPLVIMHSDGVTTRWDLAAYPGLAAQHPSLIAGVLLRDFRRPRDDASVAAMRLAG